MRFDAQAVKVKKDLLARGKQFLELTGSAYAHKMLIGKTLDEPPEEVWLIEMFHEGISNPL